MILEKDINSAFSAAISPFKEIVAYEALWLKKNATFKTLSNLFKSSPGSLPSDFVNSDEMEDIYPKVRALISKSQAKYKTNILINKTWDYPTRLKDAAEPVEILYYSGNIEYLKERSIAIVGARKPSEDGLKRANNIAKRLVLDGFTIVSGLAAGIDTMAHNTAISMNGKTIAVIGTPLGQVYPKDNGPLQDYIAENHLLVSQVPFYKYSLQPPQWNRLFFPERNKTMSALTEATIIIEASDTSGTLIQAKAALQQGRKLFILESCFQNPNIKWPAKFEKLGAKRVGSYSDIISVLGANVKEVSC
jgi:DNA processing protein